MTLTNAIIDAVILCPEVKAYLSPEALAVCKSYDYYLRTLTHLVTTCYNGQLAADDFCDILSNLVMGQLSDAYEKAMVDNGLMPDEATEAMRNQSQAFIEGEQGFVDQFSRDIIDARIDEKPIDGLLSRVNLWANRWNEVYSAALVTITSEFGGKLVWVEGDTVDKCDSCLHLDGIVAFASEWDASGVRPGEPGAQYLQCGGWNCQCRLEPTDKRRSPRALDRIMDIATAANVGKSLKYSPDQPRDENGMWTSGGGGGGSAGGGSESGGGNVRGGTDEQRGFVQSEAEKLGITRAVELTDKEKIEVMGDLPDGYYDKENDVIHINSEAFEKYPEKIPGILAHENNHGDFHNTDKEKWQRELVRINKEDIESMGDLYDFDEREDREGNYRILVSEIGGVSNYSNSYWGSRDVVTSKPTFDRAISETFAEVARLRAEGDDAIIPFWNDLYTRTFDK